MLELITDFGKAAGVIAATIYGPFEAVERLAADPLRHRISNWIKKTGEGNPAAQFTSILHAVFGPKHWSFRCFLASMFVTYAICIPILALNGGFENISYLLGCILVFVVGVIPDYLSLAKSRWIIEIMSRHRHFSAYLVLDLCLAFIGFNIYFTVSVFLSFIALPEGDVVSVGDAWHRALGITTEIYRSLHVLEKGEGDFNFWRDNFPFLLSTFTTSIWVWLYVVSIRSLRQLNPLPKFARMMQWMKFEEQPFRVIGFFAAAWAIVASVVIAGAWNIFVAK